VPEYRQLRMFCVKAYYIFSTLEGCSLCEVYSDKALFALHYVRLSQMALNIHAPVQDADDIDALVHDEL